MRNVQGVDVVNKNLDKLDSVIRQRVIDIVEQTVEKARVHAASGHPKWQGGPSPGPRFMSRTGNLQESIRPWPDVPIVLAGIIVQYLRAGGSHLGTELEYARFVEEGTSRMMAYPYMFPALMAVKDEFQMKIKALLGG